MVMNSVVSVRGNRFNNRMVSPFATSQHLQSTNIRNGIQQILAIARHMLSLATPLGVEIVHEARTQTQTIGSATIVLQKTRTELTHYSKMSRHKP